MILATLLAVLSCVVGDGIIYGIRYKFESIGPLVVLVIAFSMTISATIMAAAPCKDKLGVFMCG